jgi:o-succinylbenzoate synthase
MRVTQADVLHYRGAVEGARGASERWTQREGLLLRLAKPDGSVGQGEASPLPRYSPDTIDAARAALESIDWSRVPEAEPGEPVIGYLGRLGDVLAPLPPSARFAAETALLDLLGRARRVPLWALLADGSGETETPVPLSTFVGGADDESSVARAAFAAEKGAHTVKLKITGPRLGGQLDTLGRVREAVGSRGLRLDANRSFTDDRAGAELAALRELRPDLVEEPVPTDSLPRLSVPVPIALDESLQEPNALARLGPHLARIGIVAIVLKPMALGGHHACLRLAAEARTVGLDVTVSHLFDGPVALAAAAHLALAVGSRSRASGLDLHGALGAWPAVQVPLIGATTVLVGDRPGLGLLALPEPA